MRSTDNRNLRAGHESGKDTAPPLSLFFAWANAVRYDSSLKKRVIQDCGDSTAVIEVTDPNFFIRVSIRAGRFSIRCQKTTSEQPVFSMDARALYRILSGTQNLMIGLNKRKIECPAAGGTPDDLLRAIIYLQPELSKIFRATAAGRCSQ